jgi:hypothetical protein
MSMISSRVHAGWVALAVAALSSCASAPPAPPKPVVGIAPPVRIAPSQAPAPAPAPQQPAPVQAVPPGEPPGVAAHFPEPAVDYRTPAFQPGSTAFTTNQELQFLLQGLVREPRGVTGTTVRLLSLGTSQAGVPLQALLFTRLPDAEPAAVVRSGRPTVLLVGQQHGDEPAGSEALLVVAQELAGGRYEAWLDRLNVIVMPRANPDGARDNRRVTAGGIDANRDHLLLKTPEARAQALLVRDYRPSVIVDAHEYTVAGRYVEKFGTVQRFDAMVQYAMTANLPEFVTRASEEWFRQPLLDRLKTEGLTSEWYYTTSTDIADKKVSMGGVQPDTGRNVNGLTNAVSFLVETRGVGLGRQHLKRRVHTHVTAAASILQSAYDRAADIVKLRQFVDNDVSAQACTGEAVVEAAATPSEYGLRMLDAQSGAERTITVAWDSSLALRPLKKRPRPCGYWLPQSQADAVERLRALGVAVQQLAEDGDMRAETYRELARESGARADVRGTIADSDAIVRVKVETVPALIDVKAGGYYVPLDQPLANLVLAALEPDTQNSYFANRIVDSLDATARVMGRPTIRLTPLP